MLVNKRAKRQAAPERRGHVGDGHVSVALTMQPAPLLQRLDGSHRFSQRNRGTSLLSKWARGRGLSAEEPEESSEVKKAAAPQLRPVSGSFLSDCFLRSLR